MTRPMPTRLYHITHVANLPGIIANGLLNDLAAQGGKLSTEIGYQHIKIRRASTQVRAYSGGVVAEYVPFYFAPRSPMLYVINKGGVQTYRDGSDHIIYLVTSVERLRDLGCDLVFTDRNAVLAHAMHFTDVNELDDRIDWALMNARMWHDTASQPDRKERRMAEALVHEAVPWEAIGAIATRTEATLERVNHLISNNDHTPRTAKKQDWYF